MGHELKLWIASGNLLLVAHQLKISGSHGTLTSVCQALQAALKNTGILLTPLVHSITYIQFVPCFQIWQKPDASLLMQTCDLRSGWFLTNNPFIMCSITWINYSNHIYYATKHYCTQLSWQQQIMRNKVHIWGIRYVLVSMGPNSDEQTGHHPVVSENPGTIWAIHWQHVWQSVVLWFSSVSVWHGGQIVNDHMVQIAGICHNAWQWNWRADARHMGDILCLFLCIMSQEGRRGGGSNLRWNLDMRENMITTWQSASCQLNEDYLLHKEKRSPLMIPQSPIASKFNHT